MKKKMKIHEQTPLAKCRTKKIDNNRQITLQCNLKTTINLKDIADETSTMEFDAFTTLSERSNSTEVIDDVFQTLSGSEKDAHSPPETFRRSEKHNDEWSLTHLNEDSNGESPKRCEMNDTLTPERYSSSITDSGALNNRILCSTGIISPEIRPISPVFKEFGDISSIPCKINNTEVKSQCDPGEKSKLQGRETLSRKFTGKKIFTKIKRKNAAQVKTTEEDLQKSNEIEMPVKLTEMHSENLTPLRKRKESLLQANINEDVCETTKSILPTDFSDNITSKVNRKEPPQVTKIKHGKSKRILNEVPSEVTEMPTNLRPVNVTRVIKCKEALPQANNKDEVYETPKVVVDTKRRVLEKVLQKEEQRTEETVIPEQKRENAEKLRISNKDSLEKSVNSSLPSTIPLGHSTEHMHISEPRESSRSPSFRISQKDANLRHISKKRTVILVSEHPKKTATTKQLKRKKKSKKKITNEDELEEEIASITAPSLSTKGFIVSTESRESISVSSSRISRKKVVKPLEGIVIHGDKTKKTKTSKLVKRQKKPKRRVSNEDSSEEEILSTSSSTDIKEDSLEYMDTSESEENIGTSRISNTSSEKFLEEIGMLESDFSNIPEESISQKREKNTAYDSWWKKSLSEKLREYEEYLKTIPISELSLKKRLVKNQYRKI